ncbi:MAG: hypothetical protein R2832_10575 [Rhodothermales bacterium]
MIDLVSLIGIENSLLPYGFAVALVSLSPIASAQSPGELGMIRRLWLASADSADSLEAALTVIDSMEVGVRDHPRVMAFEGALVSMRGKHSAWPHRKIVHVRRGLRLLDAAVEKDPSDPEIRYLRMLTCEHLPKFFGRDWTVSVDAAALTSSLLTLRETLPPDFYTYLIGFVIEHGSPTKHETNRLEHELQPD